MRPGEIQSSSCSQLNGEWESSKSSCPHVSRDLVWSLENSRRRKRWELASKRGSEAQYRERGSSWYSRRQWCPGKCMDLTLNLNPGFTSYSFCYLGRINILQFFAFLMMSLWKRNETCRQSSQALHPISLGSSHFGESNDALRLHNWYRESRAGMESKFVSVWSVLISHCLVASSCGCRWDLCPPSTFPENPVINPVKHPWISWILGDKEENTLQKDR